MGLVRQGLERLFGPFTKNLDDAGKAEFNKGLDEFEKSLAEVEKADAEALAKMSEAHQTFAKGLSESERGFFAKASETERDALIKAHNEGADKMKAAIEKAKAEAEAVAKGGETVQITKADMEQAISKAVTAAVAPLQKSNDELRADLAKRDAEALEKTIASELKAAGVPGAPEVAKSLMAVPAGDAREALKKSFIASGEQIKKAALFGEIGNTGAEGGADTALAKMNRLAAEVRKADPKLSQEQAFAKVYGDPAHSDLRKAYKAERGAAN